MRYLFILLPLLYTAADAYLYWRVWQLMSALPLWARVLVSVLYWVVSFALFISIGLRDSGCPDALLGGLYRVGSVWLVLMLYLLLFLAVLSLVKDFCSSMGNTLWWALGMSVLLMVGGYIRYKHPRVEKLDIVLDKPVESVRVVAISDVHLGYGTPCSALERYVQLINAQKPDLILVVGDLIDNSVQPLRSAPYDEWLRQLEAPMGVYMVPGNHEYISGIDASTTFVESASIQMLRDSVVDLPCGLQLVGRDDRTNASRQSLSALLEQVDTSRPIVVMDHQPYGLAMADLLGVDLQLSGHTHHGQVWPVSLLTDYMYEQSHGYRRWNRAHIYVSSGLSLWGPPFRIGTVSDMAVIEIRSSNLHNNQ